MGVKFRNILDYEYRVLEHPSIMAVSRVLEHPQAYWVIFHSVSFCTFSPNQHRTGRLDLGVWGALLDFAHVIDYA